MSKHINEVRAHERERRRNAPAERLFVRIGRRDVPNQIQGLSEFENAKVSR